MAAFTSPPDRLAELQDPTRLHATEGTAIFKCAETAGLGSDDDHEGHEVHVIYWYPGSAAITDCPPCAKCGGPMVLIDGVHPKDEPLVDNAPSPLNEREDVKVALRSIGAID